MKSTWIIALGIVVGAIVIGGQSFYQLLTLQNILNEPSGEVRLGDVYDEQLTTTVTIIDADNKTPILMIMADTDQITTDVKQELSQMVKEANETLPAHQKMRLETTYFDTNVNIELTTEVTYHSQYQNKMKVTIDDTVLSHPADDQYHFAEAVDMLNTYAQKMDTIYHQNDSFIHKI
ncbi:hypothetical protein [Photobacterium angustum]|uniref:Uncharacterized protein n=1 Tax=Photobacterium angustum (strain S14 / CCUG 15956) TaxID=314292 RepID=Q1ZWM4_PHOAS|nr:hypothetical protein [Photobacterium angustum]EAS65686.1 hypothetical protein VAS14_10254 [Photobacterium angustum S14]KJG02353.1 hypothetical protein UB35_09625 [Photobacterium angustum]KJG17358.1 hypothetical protein UA33_08600 [Photobacterium angustum]KJG23826.1 hypothetical protein UA39_09150 [Photobacterium angustum]KJG31489.1 hypothetical protein UA36_10380 [Photobacterium angustum]